MECRPLVEPNHLRCQKIEGHNGYLNVNEKHRTLKHMNKTSRYGLMLIGQTTCIEFKRGPKILERIQ